MREAQLNAQYAKSLVHRGYRTVYYAQKNSRAYEIILANEILTLLCLNLHLWSVGSGERPEMQGPSISVEGGGTCNAHWFKMAARL